MEAYCIVFKGQNFCGFPLNHECFLRILALRDFYHISYMALLKYFNCVNGSSGTVLSNPESSLNRVVDQKANEAANEEAMKLCSHV